MYDCARAICKEEGLNFEEFFSTPITVAEPIANSAYGVPPAKVEAATLPKGLQFHRPAVTTGDYRDYVIGPAQGQKDGWFPLGSFSIISGPSQGGKTTLVYQMLLNQLNGVQFFGHQTYGRSFLAMGADRGEDAHKRTMERMHLAHVKIPFEPLLMTVWDIDAAQAIVDKIESKEFLPQVIFIEGIDMLVSKGTEMKEVTRFAHQLYEIASWFHVAVIGSTGAPKAREGQGYAATRDNIFGSSGWGRVAETVALIQFPKGDDTSKERKLTVTLRNAPTEKFTLAFVDGCLEVQPDGPEEISSSSVETHILREIDWFKKQARLAKNDPTKKWWTILDFERALNLPHATADRHVNDACTKKFVVVKSGTKRGRGRGGVAEFCWNESDSNPLWVEEQAQMMAEEKF
jgi:hypothetical protein